MSESNKKSATTTNYSHNKKSFTSQEICEIISECGKSGVENFEFFDLHMTFQTKKSTWGDQITPLPGLFTTQSPGQVTAISSPNDNSLVKSNETNATQDEIAEMQLQDPFQYEQLLAQKEFED